MVLEKTLENPLDSKEIKPVNPKGNQSVRNVSKSLLFFFFFFLHTIRLFNENVFHSKHNVHVMQMRHHHDHNGAVRYTRLQENRHLAKQGCKKDGETVFESQTMLPFSVCLS